MRYWTGLTLFLSGAGFLYAGLRHRHGVLARRRPAGAGDDTSPLHPSLAILGDILPGMIVAGLSWLGIKVTLVYIVFDGSRLLSPFDLAGFLFALTGYAVWLVCKTRFREPRNLAATLASELAAVVSNNRTLTQDDNSRQVAETPRARPAA